MNLSSQDLGFFFQTSHHDLSAGLDRARRRLVSAEREAIVEERDEVVAREMGLLGFYEWLLPIRDDFHALGMDESTGPIPPVPAPESEVIDVRSLCLIREFLGYVSPLADAIFAVQGLGSYPIQLATARQTPREIAASGLAQLLAACRSGRAIGGFALTEPDAGSDVASMRTVAEAVDPGDAHGHRYLLTGQKTLISNVGIASHYVVFANADPDAGRKGITAFLVQSRAEGLRERPIRLNVEHPIGALIMDRCEASLLGEVGGGFKLAMQTLDTFRVTVGAAAVGMARRALDATLEHVKTRVQFGKPLAAQQMVQGYLADMATELDAARLLVLRAAYAKDRAVREGRAQEMRSELSKQAAMAKLYATESAQRIIDHAVQLHGGRGVAAGEVVENLYRAIRPLRIYEGTSEIQRLIIGRTLTR